MGYEGLVAGRINQNMMDQYKDMKKLQLVWKAYNKTLGQSSQLYTHIPTDKYLWPPGFNMDVKYIDDTKYTKFTDYIFDQYHSYRDTGHLMILMGDDFAY